MFLEEKPGSKYSQNDTRSKESRVGLESARSRVESGFMLDPNPYRSDAISVLRSPMVSGLGRVEPLFIRSAHSLYVLLTLGFPYIAKTLNP